MGMEVLGETLGPYELPWLLTEAHVFSLPDLKNRQAKKAAAPSTGVTSQKTTARNAPTAT